MESNDCNLRALDNSKMNSDFGLARVKTEGAPDDPDNYTWECSCEKCTTRYKQAKQRYLEYIKHN